MLRLCLSKNNQQGKFHDLTVAWAEGVVKKYQNEEILKFVPLEDC